MVKTLETSLLPSCTCDFLHNWCRKQSYHQWINGKTFAWTSCTERSEFRDPWRWAHGINSVLPRPNSRDGPPDTKILQNPIMQLAQHGQQHHHNQKHHLPGHQLKPQHLHQNTARTNEFASRIDITGPRKCIQLRETISMMKGQCQILTFTKDSNDKLELE